MLLDMKHLSSRFYKDHHATKRLSRQGETLVQTVRTLRYDSKGTQYLWAWKRTVTSLQRFPSNLLK